MKPIRATLPALLALAGACKVVDAPETLEAMMVFGFVHAQDEKEIETVAEDLPGLVSNHLEELVEGYRVDSLTSADLAEVGIDKNVDEVVGAMGRVTYHNDIDAVIDAVASLKKDDLFENTTEFTVLSDTDRACFLRHECATYTVKAKQVSHQPIIGDITQIYTQDFAWVQVDDEEHIASRTLSPDPLDISSGIAAVDQQYSFFVLRPIKGGVERVEAIWAEARLLGMDLPDSFMVDQAVGAMDDQAARVDEWIDEQ